VIVIFRNVLDDRIIDIDFALITEPDDGRKCSGDFTERGNIKESLLGEGDMGAFAHVADFISVKIMSGVSDSEYTSRDSSILVVKVDHIPDSSPVVG
jgi:hypothetical protein